MTTHRRATVADAATLSALAGETFLPAWHGTGVAAQLMTAVVALALSEGGQTLWLAHHPSNTRAERFYKRQGFTDTQVCLPFYLCGRIYEDTVLVRHPLTPPTP